MYENNNDLRWVFINNDEDWISCKEVIAMIIAAREPSPLPVSVSVSEVKRMLG
jgi:hypothetical protein